MIVKCISDRITDIPKNMREFEFTQNEDGKVDLTVDKNYIVYAIRKNKYGKLVLILTDTQNTSLPWWMPYSLFKLIDESKPKDWKLDTWEGFGTETVEADPIYFNTMEDIEDSTPMGYEVFEKMRVDAETNSQQ